MGTTCDMLSRCSSCSYALASLCCTRNRNRSFDVCCCVAYWILLQSLNYTNIMKQTEYEQTCPASTADGCRWNMKPNWYGVSSVFFLWMHLENGYTEASCMGSTFCLQPQFLCFWFSWQWDRTAQRLANSWPGQIELVPWSVQGKANDMPRRATTQRDSWRPCNMMLDDVRRLRCPESRNTPSGAEDEAWSSCYVDALSARRKMSFGEYIRAMHVS